MCHPVLKMVNRKEEEPMDKTKPYEISKQVVWEAYKRVKANKGAAGIDDETIEEFEENLKGQSVQDLESDVIRQLFSPAG